MRLMTAQCHPVFVGFINIDIGSINVSIVVNGRWLRNSIQGNRIPSRWPHSRDLKCRKL